MSLSFQKLKLKRKRVQNWCHKGENYNSVFIIGKHLSGSIFGSFESARGGGDCLRSIVALIHPHLAKVVPLLYSCSCLKLRENYDKENRFQEEINSFYISNATVSQE